MLHHRKPFPKEIVSPMIYEKWIKDFEEIATKWKSFKPSQGDLDAEIKSQKSDGGTSVVSSIAVLRKAPRSRAVNRLSLLR